MKYWEVCPQLALAPSRPARGAWIEIESNRHGHPFQKSRPARGAWIEIGEEREETVAWKSRPARGAWIEICAFCFVCVLP